MKPRRLLVIGLLACCARSPINAQTPTLVSDIYTTSNLGYVSSNPRQLVRVGKRIFFLADSAVDSSSVTRLATTDGTAEGTDYLDIPCFDRNCYTSPLLVDGTGGTGNLLFFTTQPQSSSVLWRSDGTRGGTFSLTPPDFILSSANQEGAFARIGPQIFFGGCQANVCGLWKSDGTILGTRKVVPFGRSSAPDFFTAVGSQIYFFWRSTEGGLGLWVSDGTDAGTREVSKLAAGAQPGQMTAGQGRVFFTAGTSTDTELWTSDGTTAGTEAMTSFEAPNPFHSDQPFKVIGGRLYFVADDVLHGSEIWTSDGTPAGTRRVTDFGYYAPFPSPLQSAALGGRLVFLATDGLHPLQLWSTQGTPESTALVAQVQPSTNLLVPAGKDHVLFLANDSTQGAVLWTSDGTTGRTKPLLPACTGSCNRRIGNPVELDGAAFFVRTDGSRSDLIRTDGTPGGTHAWSDGSVTPSFDFYDRGAQLASLDGNILFAGSDAHGGELWSSDGKPGGTRLVADLARPTASSSPANLTAVGGTLFFTTESYRNNDIWLSTGTEASTRFVAGPGQSLAAAAGLLFFLQYDQGGYRLWRTDGSPTGTVALTGGDERIESGSFIAFRGKLLLLAERNGALELWRSDGTAAGTGALFAFPAEIETIEQLTPLNDEIYFVAHDTEGERVVWRSDGTLAGTRRVSAGIGYRAIPSFARLGSQVYFLSFDEQDRTILSRTDGTLESTTVVYRSSSSVYGNVDITDPVAFGNALYFFASTAAGSRGLFRSDGTLAGTALLRELGPAEDRYSDASPAFPTVAGGRLYFEADDGIHGREIWQTDGTTAGTTLVSDISPGLPTSNPDSLIAAGSRLFFSADDGVHGREVWQTDGTPAGTRMVGDVAPGALGSGPTRLTVAGDQLYWNANDGLHGRELWSLALSGPAGCQPSETRLCLEGNRFQVEIAWTDFQGHTGVGHAVPLTADTGSFWFFSPENLETVVKVLDARTLNGAFWVFYGALSSVEYTMTLTDTQTGLTRRYFNPANRLASVGDTAGFGPAGTYDAKAIEAPASALPLVSARSDAKAATGTCSPGPGRLCLQGGRFAVTAVWKDFQGKTGAGTAVALTPDTGYFWFFSPTNVEVMTKVLDGRGVTGKFWFFYGALSNVEYTLTVTDVLSGAVKTYKNPSGQFGSVADTGAF
jgi:ELWxxDGT repeat protein